MMRGVLTVVVILLVLLVLHGALGGPAGTGGNKENQDQDRRRAPENEEWRFHGWDSLLVVVESIPAARSSSMAASRASVTVST